MEDIYSSNEFVTVEQDDIIVNVDACIGALSFCFAEESSIFISIDPIAAISDELRYNTQSYPNVITVPKAVWTERPEKGIDHPTQRIYRQIKSGELSESELWQVYKDNLKYVLGEVIRLVRRSDCSVVVTADHGKHLGEDDKYLHEEESYLIRQVPWLVVSDSEIGTVSVKEEYQSVDLANDSQAQSSNEVEERLADLGYVDGGI